jgi:hypothetical protein
MAATSRKAGQSSIPIAAELTSANVGSFVGSRPGQVKSKSATALFFVDPLF